MTAATLTFALIAAAALLVLAILVALLLELRHHPPSWKSGPN
jgi:hypothetical protein